MKRSKRLSKKRSSRTPKGNTLFLERLEPRIVLTTMSPDSFFTFTDSADNLIWVYYNCDEATATVEVMDTGLDGTFVDGDDIATVTFDANNDSSTVFVAIVVSADEEAPDGFAADPFGGTAHILAIVGEDEITVDGSGGVEILDGVYSSTDIGTIIIGGNLGNYANQDAIVSIGGSIDYLYVGFLAGDIDVGGYAKVVDIGTHAGVVPGEDITKPTLLFTGSEMTFGENVGTIYIGQKSGGGELASDIFVAGDPEAHDVAYTEMESIQSLNSWKRGNATAEETTNDSVETAEFVSSPTGDLVITGALEGDRDLDGDGTADVTDTLDFYALNLQAGVAVTVEFTPVGLYDDVAVGLYDSAGNLVATTAVKNYGDRPGSYSYQPDTFVYIPEANGVYYLAVAHPSDWDFNGDPVNRGIQDYVITVQGAAPVTVGGVEGATNVQKLDIVVENGDFGDLAASNEVWQVDLIVQEGSVRSLRALNVGFADADTTRSAGNIAAGENVYLIQGDLIVGLNVYAGQSIDQVIASGNMLGGGFYAAEDIGQVHVAGDVGSSTFMTSVGSVVLGVEPPEYDSLRPTSLEPNVFYLLNVGGDFGRNFATGCTLCVNEVVTGVGDDVRFVNIDGSLHWTDPVTGWTLHDYGRYNFGGGADPDLRTIEDDSGAIITLSPLTSGVAYTYRILPILGYNEQYGDYFVVGNVLMDVQAGGDLTVTISDYTGIYEITMGDGALTLLMNGSGEGVSGEDRLDVYHIVASGNMQTISNQTPGDIVSMNIQKASNVHADGNIGFTSNIEGGSRIQGPDAIPEEASPAGGLVSGILGVSIWELDAGGAIGDVILSGNLVNLTANSDSVSDHEIFAYGVYDGIGGVVVVTGSIIGVVEVGDGLRPPTLDSGDSGYYAQTGIFAGAITNDYAGTMGLGSDAGTVHATGLGHDIAAPVMTHGILHTVLVDNGAQLRDFYIASIDDFSVFHQWDNAPVPGTDTVELVRATQGGSGISNGLIAGNRIDEVSTTDGGSGIFNVDIMASQVYGALGTPAEIGRVSAVGFGIDYCTIHASSGRIGYVTAVEEDIRDSFISAVKIFEIRTADDLIGTEMLAYDTMGSILVGDELLDSEVSGGRLYQLVAVNDITGLTVTMAGQMDLIQSVAGSIDANIFGLGPFANIITIQAYNDLHGTILSYGKVWEIVTETGDCDAEIILLGTYSKLGYYEIAGDSDGDVKVRGSIYGIDVGGDITGLITTGSNTIGSFAAGSLTGATIHAYGGNIGPMTITGAVTNSLINAKGIASLSIGGDLIQSNVLSGFDVGFDHVIGGGDDTLGQGAIGAVAVGGNVRASSIAAGVSPGVDTIFGNGNDVGAGGATSTIASITVTGFIDDFGTGGFYGFLADSGTFNLTWNAGLNTIVASTSPQYVDPGPNHIRVQIL